MCWYRKQTCTSNQECQNGETCFRHHDRRNVHKGLCMKDAVNCGEQGHNDCKLNGPARKCCSGQYCCDESYFFELQKLPCDNHWACKDLRLGEYCCPNKSNSSLPSTCCDMDPNPKPAPVKPKEGGSFTSDKGAAGQLFASLLLIGACAVLSTRR
jgi:hypothetical protein